MTAEFIINSTGSLGANVDVIEEIITTLFNAGKVKSVVDLFYLDIDTILSIDEIGMQSTNTFLDEIDKIKATKLMDYQVFECLGISKSSDVSFQEILKDIHYTKILQSCDDILDGKNPIDFLHEDILKTIIEKKEELDKLLRILKVAPSFSDNKQLKGTGNIQTICFTGKGFLPRSKLAIIADKMGYEYVSTVGKNVDVLVCEDPFAGTTKLKNAQQNGTKIMSYEEFFLLAEKENYIIGE